MASEVVDRDGIIHCDPDCPARHGESILPDDPDAATEPCPLCCSPDDVDPDYAER